MIKQPKAGALVFFEKMKTSTHPSSPIFRDKKGGHYYGILLGHVPLRLPDPGLQLVLNQLGAIGFCSFDDITEFLGAEVCAEVIKKFEAKYSADKLEEPKEKPIVKRVPTIVDHRGNALESQESQSVPEL